MKTSNIILSAIFVSILIWIFAVFMTAKRFIRDASGEENELVENIINEDEIKTIELESFETIHVKGKGTVFITKANKNSLVIDKDIDNPSIIKNGTLYINVIKQNQQVYLNTKKINQLYFKGNVNVQIYNFETDTLKILSKDMVVLNVNNVKTNFIKLKSEDNSEVHFNNVNKKGTKVEFDIKDNSEVIINNTKGMEISVKKESDAKYKDY